MGRNSIYDSDPAGYDQMRQCWLNQHREEFITGWLQRKGLRDGSTVLEIGSGSGLLLRNLGRRFPDLRFVGIDPIAGYVEYARTANRSANVAFVESTAEAIPLNWPGVAHVVLSNDVLHHVESLPRVMTSLHQITAAGCQWLVIEPNWKNPYTFIKQSLMADERNFWPREFQQEAVAAGWRLSGSRHLFLVPPFIRRPPRMLIIAERWLEQVPVLAGGICLELEFQGSGPPA